MRVILASGALSAALALVMAQLRFPVVADALALAAALCGLAAFSSAAVSTIRRAGKLPSGSSPP